jgi:thioredoxin family protein
VALDNKMATWIKYQNHYWPHVYLVDAKGRIRFDHIGEGGDDLIQARLRSLLAETGASLPAPVDFTNTEPSPNITPEIYAGFDRGAAAGTIANREGYRPGSVVDYEAVAASRIARSPRDGIVFLEGRWGSAPEYLEAAEDGAKLTVPYAARDVFVVASAASGPVTIRLLLGGKAVPDAIRASDAREGSVRVAFSDLYALIHAGAPRNGDLTLVAGKGLRIYTFTFG